MFISAKPVSLSNVLAKLSVANRGAAAALAHRLRHIEAPTDARTV